MAAERDVLLELIGDVQGALDLEEFRADLLAALKRAVPCDWISLNDLGRDPASAVVLIDPPSPRGTVDVFARLAHQNPLLIRFQRTRDGRAYRFSDVVTREELHVLALYREFYGPIGLEHQIAFVLPHDPERVLAVALSRRREDFSDGERALIDRARPFMIQAYRNAVEHSRLRTRLAHPGRQAPAGGGASLAETLAARGLTRREAEVLGWVATGRSDSAVADQLGISERTVQKHLERGYRKLGVSTRSAAATLAWSLLAS